MGCFPWPRRRRKPPDLVYASDNDAKKQRDGPPSPASPPASASSAGSGASLFGDVGPVDYVIIDADAQGGAVTTGRAPDAAALAALLTCPDRDARLLAPAPPGAPPPPSLIATRGDVLLIGLEGVRLAVSSSRAVVLAAPASARGALDAGACVPPSRRAPLVRTIAAAAAGPSFVATVLDASLDCVASSLDARAAAVAVDAAAAGDALLLRLNRRSIARVRAAKRELADVAGAARRVSRALKPRRAPAGAAAALAAAARRADAAGAAVADAAAGARSSERAVRLDARRRSLAWWAC